MFVWVQKKGCLRLNAQNFTAQRWEAVPEVWLPGSQKDCMLSEQGFPGSCLLCISAASPSYQGESWVCPLLLLYYCSDFLGRAAAACPVGPQPVSPGTRLWDSSQILAAAQCIRGLKKVSCGHQKTLVAGCHLGQIWGAIHAPFSSQLKFTEVTSPATIEKICKIPSWFWFFNSGWRIKEVFNTMPPLCCYVTYIPFTAQDKLE